MRFKINCSPLSLLLCRSCTLTFEDFNQRKKKTKKTKKKTKKKRLLRLK